MSIQQFQFNPNPKKYEFLLFLTQNLHSSYSKSSHFFVNSVHKLWGKQKSQGTFQNFNTKLENWCLKINKREKDVLSWIVMGFELDCQSILKSGFGFGLSIINLQRIWIGLTIQKNRIEQYPAFIRILCNNLGWYLKQIWANQLEKNWKIHAAVTKPI